MRKFKIKMGQAMAGDLREVRLFSTAFQSCSAIAVYNENTKRGALYHFPANALKTSMQDNKPVLVEDGDAMEILENLFVDVKPTHAVIMPGPFSGAQYNDVMAVKGQLFRLLNPEMKQPLRIPTVGDKIQVGVGLSVEKGDVVFVSPAPADWYNGARDCGMYAWSDDIPRVRVFGYNRDLNLNLDAAPKTNSCRYKKQA